MTRRWFASTKVQVLLWVGQLCVVALCAVAFLLWILGTPGVGGSAYAKAWGLGLSVIMYYPPAILAIFLAGRLHRLLAKPASKAKVEIAYIMAGYALLAVAVVVMLTVLIRIFIG